MPSTDRPSSDSAHRIRIAPPEVTVRDWAPRDRPISSLVSLTIALLAVWLAVTATGNVLVGWLVAAALAITLWRTWLPVRYELSGSGIVQSVLGWRRRIPWTAVLHYEIRSSGVLLLPDAQATPLSALRGLFLHFGRQRDEIIAQLDYYLHTWTAANHSTQPPSTEEQVIEG